MGGFYAMSFTTTSALTVTNVTPASGATNVPVNTTITLTFNSNIQQGPSYANITLTSGTFTSAITGNTLTITPTSTLPYGTYALLTIPANAVINSAGTPMGGFYAMSFTTTSALAGVTPASGATNVPVNTTTPARTVTAVTPASGATNVPVNTTTPARTVTNSTTAAVTTASTAHNNTTAAVTTASTASTAHNNTTAAVTTASTAHNNTTAAVTTASTAHNNTTAAVTTASTAHNNTTAAVTTASTTTPSLTVTAVTPASGATNVPLNTTITLTFNSNIQQGPSYANITLTSGTFTTTITGNTLTITPTSTLPYGTYVLLTIPANALHTVNGTHMAGTYVMALTTSSSQTDRL
jgi:methionine-rich copper-binding protein CopC